MTEFNFRDEQHLPPLSRTRIRERLQKKWSRHCAEGQYPSAEIVKDVVKTADAALSDFLRTDEKELLTDVVTLKSWGLTGFQTVHIRINSEGPVTVKVSVAIQVTGGYSLRYAGWSKVFIDAIAKEVGLEAESHTHLDGEHFNAITSRYLPVMETLESSFTISY